MNNTVDVEIIRNYFRRRPEVRAVFLFGSFAQNKARSASDVDIAVLLDVSIPSSAYLDRRLTWMHELSGPLQRELDVTILNEAGPVLKHQIFEFGKLLYETDRHHTTSFKARSMIEYVDWLPYKDRLDQAVLRHFKRTFHG